MNYRIVVETEKSGKKSYYLQKRVMWYFWAYLRECRDISMYQYRVCFDDIQKAEQRIQADVNADYAKSQSKIVSREILNR
jgi:hypothetical protein